MANAKMDLATFKQLCPVSPDSVRDHVRNCSRCHVSEGGEVWYCKTGADLVQQERKRRFFGAV